MTVGPGVYDAEACELLERLQAQGVVLVVSGGIRGNQVAVAVKDPSLLLTVAAALRELADMLETDAPRARS